MLNGVVFKQHPDIWVRWSGTSNKVGLQWLLKQLWCPPLDPTYNVGNQAICCLLKPWNFPSCVSKTGGKKSTAFNITFSLFLLFYFYLILYIKWFRKKGLVWNMEVFSALMWSCLERDWKRQKWNLMDPIAVVSFSRKSWELKRRRYRSLINKLKTRWGPLT